MGSPGAGGSLWPAASPALPVQVGASQGTAAYAEIPVLAYSVEADYSAHACNRALSIGHDKSPTNYHSVDDRIVLQPQLLNGVPDVNADAIHGEFQPGGLDAQLARALTDQHTPQ